MALTTDKPLSSPATYLHILCIEEHGEISILLSKMLPNTKGRIVHVRNRVQAARHLEIQQPALIIIDNNFYGNSGITYAAELKAKFPTMKLMMLSAAQDGQIKQDASHAGLDILLIKPFTKSQLLDSVTALLNIQL